MLDSIPRLPRLGKLLTIEILESNLKFMFNIIWSRCLAYFIGDHGILDDSIMECNSKNGRTNLKLTKHSPFIIFEKSTRM